MHYSCFGVKEAAEEKTSGPTARSSSIGGQWMP